MFATSSNQPHAILIQRLKQEWKHNIAEVVCKYTRLLLLYERLVLKSIPSEFSLLAAKTVLTAALNLRLALNFLNLARFVPRSRLARVLASAPIHLLPKALPESYRSSGFTQSRLRIKSLASSETCPQYSSWNSYCPFRILRKSVRWLDSINGGYPPNRMYTITPMDHISAWVS